MLLVLTQTMTRSSLRTCSCSAGVWVQKRNKWRHVFTSCLLEVCLTGLVLCILISPLFNDTLVRCFDKKGKRQWGCYRNWFRVNCGTELWTKKEKKNNSHRLWSHLTESLLMQFMGWFTHFVRNKLTFLEELSPSWWYVECLPMSIELQIEYTYFLSSYCR